MNQTINKRWNNHFTAALSPSLDSLKHTLDQSIDNYDSFITWTIHHNEDMIRCDKLNATGNLVAWDPLAPHRPGRSNTSYEMTGPRTRWQIAGHYSLWCGWDWSGLIIHQSSNLINQALFQLVCPRSAVAVMGRLWRAMKAQNRINDQMIIIDEIPVSVIAWVIKLLCGADATTHHCHWLKLTQNIVYIWTINCLSVLSHLHVVIKRKRKINTYMET